MSSFTATATTEIYALSLHDAFRSLGASRVRLVRQLLVESLALAAAAAAIGFAWAQWGARQTFRSEEHTSELQSHSELVCRLLLEKKKLRRIPRGTRVFTALLFKRM